MSLVSPNGQPLRGAKILSSRQLTITIDPVAHAMLDDLSKFNGVSQHEAAEEYLTQAIRAAHTQLRFAKFLFCVSHWYAWSEWS